MALAPKIDETIKRTDDERYRAIENAGYKAAKSGRYTNADNPYFDNGADGEAWNDGFFEALDEE